MSDLVGETSPVPRHQLRDDLEVGDTVNANGFLFEVLSISEDWVELECIENLIEYHKKYDEDIGLVARLKALRNVNWRRDGWFEIPF